MSDTELYTQNTLHVTARTKDEAKGIVSRDVEGDWVYEELFASGPTENVYQFRRSKR